MKKKFFSFLLLFVILIGLSACGKKSKVEEVIEKFNNCKTVKSYKDYGYEMNASFKNDVYLMIGSLVSLNIVIKLYQILRTSIKKM